MTKKLMAWHSIYRQLATLEPSDRKSDYDFSETTRLSFALNSSRLGVEMDQLEKQRVKLYRDRLPEETRKDPDAKLEPEADLDFRKAFQAFMEDTDTELDMIRIPHKQLNCGKNRISATLLGNLMSEGIITTPTEAELGLPVEKPVETPANN